LVFVHGLAVAAGGPQRGLEGGGSLPETRLRLHPASAAAPLPHMAVASKAARAGGSRRSSCTAIGSSASVVRSSTAAMLSGVNPVSG